MGSQIIKCLVMLSTIYGPAVSTMEAALLFLPLFLDLNLRPNSSWHTPVDKHKMGYTHCLMNLTDVWTYWYLRWNLRKKVSPIYDQVDESGPMGLIQQALKTKNKIIFWSYRHLGWFSSWGSNSSLYFGLGFVLEIRWKIHHLWPWCKSLLIFRMLFSSC